jgi:sterol 3beta-glucosyltransferase
VHHGGFGTTAAGLRAGIPNVVVPHIIVQFIWARRVYELGAGPEPISRSKLSAPKLAHALSRAMSDAGLCRTAEELGRQIRLEDGVAEAVGLIQAEFRAGAATTGADG